MTYVDSHPPFTVSYRGYVLTRHPSGIIGIFSKHEPNPISTAASWDEAEGIIDAWLDQP